MICTLFTQNYTIRSYAFFPQFFWGKKAESALLECMSQSRRNRSKIDESTQKDSDDGKLFIISTNEETQNEKNGANKDKETKIQKGISSSFKREEVVNRRLGRNLEPNLQLAKKILPVETFPKVFPGLDDPHTYADFILAVGNFPVCTPSTSSTPSTCREELASMAFFANEARCAGKILTFKCCNTIKGCCPVSITDGIRKLSRV